ncbi:MAG: cytochrome c3 family protein [Deltaproteobacteria bacterium]|nr:cytochrome c3 family protein [Deltaproteobacteria bacterium]
MKLPSLGRTARIVVLVGAAVFALIGWRTYSYVQHDPTFCTSCHIMDDAYDKWAGSVHQQVTCHECHANDIQANLRQLWVYWTEPPEKPQHRPEVENSTCYECHRVGGAAGDHDAGKNEDPNWKHVLAESGHAWHVTKQRIQCIRCHSTSVHQFVPPSQVCVECHKHENLEKTSMDEHCTSCHAFKAINRESLKPARSDCLGCHEEMQVSAEVFPKHVEEAKDAPMAWDCGKCHKPHTKPKLESADCKGCHQEKLKDSDLHAVADHDVCTNCHLPHSWYPDVPKTCQAECHSDKTEEHTEGNVCTDCHE